MGKISIVAAIIFSLIGFILLGISQETSRETDLQQGEYLSGQLSRELAIKGRKLILARWMGNSGASMTAPDTMTHLGGKIVFRDFSVTPVNGNNVIDFKARGIYEGEVHEIRSRFQYNNFTTNLMQLKVADLNFDIVPGADLTYLGSIAIDDQALNDLESIVVDELGIADSLGEYGLGANAIKSHIENELYLTNNTDIGVNIIDGSDRNMMDQTENGMYFPDQVMQAVAEFSAANPGTELTIADGSMMPGSFGGGSHSIVRVQDNLTITAGNTVSGNGILIVEGNLVVEDNANFNWEGIILLVPPQDNLNPQLDLTGPTNINGMIVALQETIPTTGHMDVTSFRDMTGQWTDSYSVDFHYSPWPWFLFHQHNFTKLEGNSVTFFAPTSAERVHENYVYFEETLNLLTPGDSVIFELYNRGAHGRGIVTMDLLNQPEVSFPAAAGFDPSVASPSNPERTVPLPFANLERLRFDVTRLSSLKKMWDDPENPYPDCTLLSGVIAPPCVAETHYRQNAITLRLYRQNLANGIAPTRIYETSLYWHRNYFEEEDFENEMNDYISDLTSQDYGLDFTIGDSTSITITDDVINGLTPIGDLRLGYRNLTNLGTWHQHWAAGDPENPLLTISPSD